MNHQEPDKQLEELIHQQLRALPELRAPADLIPNTLRRIAAQQARVWWRSPWLEWPRGMRLLSLAALAALLAAAGWFGRDLTLPAAQVPAWITSLFQMFKPVLTVTGALASSVRVVAGSIKPQYLILAATGFAMLYASILALGTACYRVALGRPLNS